MHTMRSSPSWAANSIAPTASRSRTSNVFTPDVRLATSPEIVLREIKATIPMACHGEHFALYTLREAARDRQGALGEFGTI